MAQPVPRADFPRGSNRGGRFLEQIAQSALRDSTTGIPEDNRHGRIFCLCADLDDPTGVGELPPISWTTSGLN